MDVLDSSDLWKRRRNRCLIQKCPMETHHNSGILVRKSVFVFSSDLHCCLSNSISLTAEHRMFSTAKTVSYLDLCIQYPSDTHPSLEIVHYDFVGGGCD